MTWRYPWWAGGEELSDFFLLQRPPLQLLPRRAKIEVFGVFREGKLADTRRDCPSTDFSFKGAARPRP